LQSHEGIVVADGLNGRYLEKKNNELIKNYKTPALRETI
jgi:hypothetical protein